MSRTNKILDLDKDQIQQIDRLLCRGKSKASISREFGVSEDSVRNYEQVHLPARALAGSQRSLKAHTERLFDELLDLAQITKDILKTSLEDGHRGLSLKAVQQNRNNIETLTRFVISMEELQMKQNTVLEVSAGNSYINAAWHKNFKKLPNAEKLAFQNTLLKCLHSTGPTHYEEDTTRVDPEHMEPEIVPIYQAPETPVVPEASPRMKRRKPKDT